jgi:hypothetical protein
MGTPPVTLDLVQHLVATKTNALFIHLQGMRAAQQTAQCTSRGASHCQKTQRQILQIPECFNH